MSPFVDLDLPETQAMSDLQQGLSPPWRCSSHAGSPTPRTCYSRAVIISVDLPDTRWVR